MHRHHFTLDKIRRVDYKNRINMLESARLYFRSNILWESFCKRNWEVYHFLLKTFAVKTCFSHIKMTHTHTHTINHSARNITFFSYIESYTVNFSGKWGKEGKWGKFRIFKKMYLQVAPLLQIFEKMYLRTAPIPQIFENLYLQTTPLPQIIEKTYLQVTRKPLNIQKN